MNDKLIFHVIIHYVYITLHQSGLILSHTFPFHTLHGRLIVEPLNRWSSYPLCIQIHGHHLFSRVSWPLLRISRMESRCCLACSSPFPLIIKELANTIEHSTVIHVVLILPVWASLFCGLLLVKRHLFQLVLLKI